MRHARRVRVGGEDMKFFVDGVAYDEQDEETFARVVLYGANGERWHWNLSEPLCLISAARVKKVFAEGKFIRVR